MEAVVNINKRGRSKVKTRRDTFYFYLCISPWLIGFLGLTIGPMLYSLFGAMSDWDGVQSPQFIGFGNFISLFKDETFIKATINTFYYVAVSVPSSILMALFLAFLLNIKFPGAGIYQGLFYFTAVSAGIAVYVVWIWLFNSELGVFNYILSTVGI